MKTDHSEECTVDNGAPSTVLPSGDAPEVAKCEGTPLTPDHRVVVSTGTRQSEKHWRKWEGTVEEFAAKFFEEHDVGVKDGFCITQGPLVGTQRISNDVTSQTIIMGDFDNGLTGDELQAKLEEAGLAAILWTTFSHLKSETEIAQSTLDKFAKEEDFGCLVEAAKHYLATKKGVVESLVQTVTNVDLVHRSGGAKYVVQHDPMPRWRVLCFLAEPFEFVVAGTSQKERIDEWKRRYVGWADKLGVTLDEKCKDPARLMFTPRRPRDTAAHLHQIRFVEGRLATLEDLPLALTTKEKEKKVKDEADALVSFGPAGPAPQRPGTDGANFVTPNLKVFLAKYGKGFLAKSWLASVTEPRRIVDETRTEFECPLDEMHSNAGDPNDKAFFAADAEPLSEPPTAWTMYCGHATCSGHTGGDRAKYLDAACLKYGVEDALELVGFVDPGFRTEADNAPTFTLNDKKKVQTLDPHNVREVLRVEGVTIDFDDFAKKKYVRWGGKRELYTDLTRDLITMLCRNNHDFTPVDRAVKLAVSEQVSRNTFDPLRAYVEGLPTWDKQPRVDDFFIRHAGAEDTRLNREYSRVFFSGMVTRAVRPGAKFDTVLVLEGEQGIGKSSLLRALCPDPDWFTDALDAHDDTKQVMQKTSGKWLAEIAEAAGLGRADRARLKAMLSREADSERLAYKEENEERKRRFVFAMTTNEAAYLTDMGGNRRYMPVRCEKYIDVTAVQSERDQLFSEALARLNAGEANTVAKALWPDSRAATAARLLENDYEADLRPVFENVAGRVKTTEVYALVGITREMHNANSLKGRVRDCMKLLGWRQVDSESHGTRSRLFMRVPDDWTQTGKSGLYTMPNGAQAALPLIEPDLAGTLRGGIAVDRDGRAVGPVPINDTQALSAGEDKALRRMGSPQGIAALANDAEAVG
jgi:putative DNA primase/helicase